MEFIVGSLICTMSDQEGGIVTRKKSTSLVVRSVNKDFIENLEETWHVRDVSGGLSEGFPYTLKKFPYLNCIFLVSILRTHIS